MLASSWITNLGDGVGLAAGPLLVASQTDDAFLVAMAALLQRLPWLLLGLHAGVVADRHDRRRIVVVANLARAAVLLRSPSQRWSTGSASRWCSCRCS
ncbi:MAG: MFS transporter [Ilumatobacteraceae bacterium]